MKQEYLEMRNGFILLEAIPQLETKSGLILPVESDNDKQISRVKVVETCENSEYKKNDTVFVSKVLPEDVELTDHDGVKHEYWIIKEDRIRAVVRAI